MDALINRILVLLNGDKTTLQRLVDSATARHPGKPQKWYLEKIIFDLERDRC